MWFYDYEVMSIRINGNTAYVLRGILVQVQATLN